MLTGSMVGISEEWGHHIAELRSALLTARREHFRIIWLVGGLASDRSAIIRGVAGAEDGALLDVGKLLSATLIDIPLPHRAVSVDDAFSEILSSGSKDLLCLDHLEILFETSLLLQPIDLVRNASRRFLLLASWPGTFSEDFLIFGSEDHPAHLKIPRQDLECLIHFI
jgi:hypothetical protein